MVQVIIVAPASIIRAGVHAILSRAPNAALSGVTGDLTVARRWMRSTAGRPHAGVDRIGSESADPHPLAAPPCAAGCCACSHVLVRRRRAGAARERWRDCLSAARAGRDRPGACQLLRSAPRLARRPGALHPGAALASGRRPALAAPDPAETAGGAAAGTRTGYSGDSNAAGDEPQDSRVSHRQTAGEAGDEDAPERRALSARARAASAA